MTTASKSIEYYIALSEELAKEIDKRNARVTALLQRNRELESRIKEQEKLASDLICENQGLKMKIDSLEEWQ